MEGGPPDIAEARAIMKINLLFEKTSTTHFPGFDLDSVSRHEISLFRTLARAYIIVRFRSRTRMIPVTSIRTP